LSKSLLLAVVLFLVLVGPSLPAVHPASLAYAKAGAYASYTAEGGFIPFFSGVSGNITYTVKDVFSNGSMALSVFENITAGTDLPPFITTLNITDSAQYPRNFPAVPPSSLATGLISFQNTTATFYTNATISVPAGTFEAMGFEGTNNGTTAHFWFDSSTGLAVEMDSGASALQLDSSNIATPAGPPASASGELAYVLVFVVAFVLGGGSYLWVRHHYGGGTAKGSGKAKAGSR
jgi:hypothetical protein